MSLKINIFCFVHVKERNMFTGYLWQSPTHFSSHAIIDLTNEDIKAK